MNRFARRISQTSKKGFGMYEKAARMTADGVDLIQLAFGKPHHDTPEHIKQATIDALRAGKVHYSDIRGEPALRRAIADKLAASNGIVATPDEILVTNGLTHASYVAFMALLDEGDEAILLEPYYPQHASKIEHAGATVVTAPLDRDAGFRVRPKWIEERVTRRTKMIVLVNPANPIGRVFSREELQAIADIAIKHDLLVASDEVYEQILFDGAEHISIASLPGMRERTLSMFAFTKAFAMDGWRLGYVCADASLMPGLLKVSMNDVTHVNTFIQYGGRAALVGDPAAMLAMVDDDRRKRDLVVRRLNQMPNVRCAMPEGSIYVFPDIRATGRTSQDLADAILQEAHVAVESGAFYGALGEGHLRICFGAESIERLDEGMTRLSRFFNKL